MVLHMAATLSDTCFSYRTFWQSLIRQYFQEYDVIPRTLCLDTPEPGSIFKKQQILGGSLKLL